MKNIGKKNYKYLFFILPALVWVLAFTIYPFFYSIIISFTDMSLQFQKSAKFIGLQNYKILFADPSYWNSVNKSLIFTVTVVAFQFLFGFLLALLLSHKKRFVSVIRMSVMLPWVLPPIALALVWGWVLQAGNMGLVNSVLVQFGFQSVAWFGTKWAMVSIIFVTIWIGVPLSFMFEMASLQKIPEELYEAGSIDGTGFFQKLFYITIPLMKDTFRINLIMITIATIGYFDIIYAITEGGPNEMTEVLPMLTYHTAFKSSAMGKGAAISVTMLLISVLFCLLYIVIFHEKKGEE